MTDFDLPSAEDILQETAPEELDRDPGAKTHDVLPVRIEGVVQTDEMPSLAAYRNYLLPTGSRAIKLLNADARRKRVLLWPVFIATGAEAICIASTEGDANIFQGALIPVTAAVQFVYEITDRGELWAVPLVINDTGGTWTGFGVSTDDVFLSAVVEQWAR